jgi:hypothetical protein
LLDKKCMICTVTNNRYLSQNTRSLHEIKRHMQTIRCIYVYVYMVINVWFTKWKIVKKKSRGSSATTMTTEIIVYVRPTYEPFILQLTNLLHACTLIADSCMHIRPTGPYVHMCVSILLCPFHSMARVWEIPPIIDNFLNHGNGTTSVRGVRSKFKPLLTLAH